jgi:TM2 domain-containing membrane protein YozV
VTATFRNDSPQTIEQTAAARRIFSRGGFQTMRDPVLAGVLSLVIPGVGQLYNGRILAGILWLIFTPGFWIGTGGTLGWICHIIAAYTAYSYAKEHPVRV